MSKKLPSVPSTSTSNQSALKELENENIATHDGQVNNFTSDDMFVTDGNITEEAIKTGQLNDKPADSACL